MKRYLCVFLKYPDPGCVKTRLAQSLGDLEAAEIYQRLVCSVLLEIRTANPDVISIFFSPSEKKQAIKDWLSPWLRDFQGQVEFHAQCEGNLGDRLKHATGVIFGSEAEEAAVLTIGSDCIDLTRELLYTAWDVLARENPPVVLGPASDGGYYLIGTNEPIPELFDKVAWSTGDVLATTMENAAARNKQCFLLPEKIDIDTISEYQQFEDRLKKRPCVFFDRDGVVNQSPGSGYVLKKEDFILSPGIVESLRSAREKGYLTIVVTSQKGVGKKLMSENDLNDIHRNLQTVLGEDGVAFDAIYFYTGTSGCAHRAKPDPAMISAAAEDFPIDLSQSWMIGDADRDIEMGRNANLRGTIRIRGDKPILIDADHTLESALELPKLLRKLL